MNHCSDAFLFDSQHEDNLRALLKPYHFRAAVDVGAHVGLWTSALAAVSDVVYSFEPHPVAFADLVENCRHLQNVVFFNEACWVKDGEMLLNCFFHPSHSTLLNEHPIPSEVGPLKGGMTVKTVRLESAVPESDIQNVDFIKIDAEGAEVQVLAGAGKLFKHPSAWLPYGLKYLIECHTEDSLKLIRELLTDGHEERYSVAKYWTNL